MTTRARLPAILALSLLLPLAATAEPAPAVQAPAVQPPVAQKPAANAPALDAASPAAPETTVGGGAANRGAAVPPPVTMPAGSATGSLLQTLFALIVVLGVLGALAWFLKRYGPKAMGGGANLRVVGSLNLGGRERLLVVEIGNQWIVRRRLARPRQRAGHDAETGKRRHGRGRRHAGRTATAMRRRRRPASPTG